VISSAHAVVLVESDSQVNSALNPCAKTRCFSRESMIRFEDCHVVNIFSTSYFNYFFVDFYAVFDHSSYSKD
jgi:hypothetical protein